ncbi:Selenoprotein W [Fasciolopsis buskii]|uniref:Selenoprotein W n=1 Tax=Fasciolopsis buskii TaxID=27845 RepID=A0A8E0VIN5_9TREM|nr:Selenoprotein W [Fasciolopsis buski]
MLSTVVHEATTPRMYLTPNGKFRAFKKELERRVSSPLQIVSSLVCNSEILQTSEGTPQVTGWFEVQIVNGPLIHSKKRGDGFVDSEEKWKKVVDAINSFM